MKKLEKWQSKVNNLISNNYFIAGVLLLTVYLIFNLGYVINEKFLSSKTPSNTTAQINKTPGLKPVEQPAQQQNQTESNTQQSNQPATPTTSKPTSTPASIAAEEADKAAKRLSWCMDYELKAWQTFTSRQKQADDYVNTHSDEYLAAYQNQLINKDEFNDLMTRIYNTRNDAISKAYQLYYDDVIGQRCTNIKSSPKALYWNI